MAKEPEARGFTLIELMIVLAVLAIVLAVSLLKIGNLMQASRIESAKGQMKSLEVAIKNYSRDMRGYPGARNPENRGLLVRGLGVTAEGDFTTASVGNSTAPWGRYLVEGRDHLNNALSTLTYTGWSGPSGPWNGPYLPRLERSLWDPWGHRYIFFDFSRDGDPDTLSCIISMGPQGVPDGTAPNWGTFEPWRRAARLAYPPDKDGFSRIPFNNNPANRDTNFFLVLWLE